MELKQIASFQVDHTKLVEGMYTSRVDGDITTYELSDQVIYVGPMGCRTGFYFLVRNMEPAVAIDLINDMLAFIADFEGDVPGATEVECGNYREQYLEGAKNIARKMIPILLDRTHADLAYEK